MPLDFEALDTDGTLGSLEAAVRSIAQAAYNQGLKDGVAGAAKLETALGHLSEAMKGFQPELLETVKRQVASLSGRTSNGAGISLGSLPIDSDVPMPDGRSRARRGLVGATITKALKASPGLTVGEYEQLVSRLEPEISVKSVGNELRRGERDGRYKRDRPGGYLWYLAGSDETETEGQSSEEPSASYSNQGGGDD